MRYENDGESSSTWRIIPISPLSRVVPLPNGLKWLVNGGDPNHLLSGMILQVVTRKKKHLGYPRGSVVPCVVAPTSHSLPGFLMGKNAEILEV